MANTNNYFEFVPQIDPQKMSGTITYKIRIKKEYVRSDGTSALYLDIYQNRKKKKFNLNLSVPVNCFDDKKQRIKNTFKYYKDYNLVIEKLLADINAIEINYRLNNETLTIDDLIQDLTKPSLRISYIEFYQNLLDNQLEKGIIKQSTYNQQQATLSKIRQFKNPCLFSDITEDFVQEFKSFLKNKLNNQPATVEIAIKNFKKYLHAANEKGIKTPILYNKIKVKAVQGSITFLLPEEVKKLYNLYNSDFINYTWKAILQRYLFSCFTGLRLSDIEAITNNNFFGDEIVFTTQKTQKLQRIKLNKTAKSLIKLPEVFMSTYSRKTINLELKKIATACGIKKRLYFHSSRHTFATNYLIAGGQIQNLQKALGHSKINTTMVYVSVVESLLNDEIGYLDDIIT